MKNCYPKNITLCGIKHSGKSSAAKALSRLTGLPFADSDDVLQELFHSETGKSASVREIYQELGEEKFRQLEVRALRKLFSCQERKITALGGGVLSNPYLSDMDRSGFGFLCFLDAEDEIAYQRILRNGLPPFLEKAENPFMAFCEMNTSRREIFRSKADFILKITDKNTTPQLSAERILSAYREDINE